MNMRNQVSQLYKRTGKFYSPVSSLWIFNYHVARKMILDRNLADIF